MKNRISLSSRRWRKQSRR